MRRLNAGVYADFPDKEFFFISSDFAASSPDREVGNSIGRASDDLLTRHDSNKLFDRGALPAGDSATAGGQIGHAWLKWCERFRGSYD